MKGPLVNSRKLAGASAASVGAATAVAALLLGTLTSSAGERTTASAFGIAADGLIDIDPTPYVEAPPDESKSLLEVPGSNQDGLHIALFKVEAEKFRSKATAVKVDILDTKIKILTATCENGRGDSEIITTDDNGKSSGKNGTDLDLSPVVKIEFNRQYRDHDYLTVDAAVIKLLPGGNLRQTISEKDLNILRKLAASRLQVPTMDQVKEAQAKSKPPAGSAPTVADLVNSVKTLNPALAKPKGNGDDSLLEIVISSATCKEERKREERKEEAPKPKPVEADLPVTH